MSPRAALSLSLFLSLSLSLSLYLSLSLLLSLSLSFSLFLSFYLSLFISKPLVDSIFLQPSFFSSLPPPSLPFLSLTSISTHQELFESKESPLELLVGSLVGSAFIHQPSAAGIELGEKKARQKAAPDS
jgi:hypothetical protein